MKVFDFIQFYCVLLTFNFAFDDLESLLQNTGLVWTGSKLGNVRLGNGES
jgi:hypothetical protein